MTDSCSSLLVDVAIAKWCCVLLWFTVRGFIHAVEELWRGSRMCERWESRTTGTQRSRYDWQMSQQPNKPQPRHDCGHKVSHKPPTDDSTCIKSKTRTTREVTDCRMRLTLRNIKYMESLVTHDDWIRSHGVNCISKDNSEWMCQFTACLRVNRIAEIFINVSILTRRPIVMLRYFWKIPTDRRCVK